MKKITTLLVALLFAASAAAVPATFSVSFDPVPPAGISVEYGIEVKAANGAWVEVVRGPTSPLSFSRDVPIGGGVIRVFARAKDGSIPRDIKFDTSAEIPFVVGVGTPSNVKVTVNRDGSTTIGISTPAQIQITPSKK